MTGRARLMQYRGVFRCPVWCTQDEDAEPENECHLGMWSELSTEGGHQIRMRAFSPWQDGGGIDGVEIWIDGEPAMVLTSDDLSNLIRLGEPLAEQGEAFDAEGDQWAYGSAEDDEAAADEAAADEQG
jgi:hypothetical protein